ncbi:FapA family protein [Virgibacillus litoralis]|uniref:Uncharacterized protein (DUF342 family) n=1 Tax=Virgibacillus litoralis TaxID=578221 RepID=A0ABS4HE04_9BACI|nr:FapA family protein [Virgibacillus litoralis]MBP1949150.1 uncharacterized protein (DUF342 family) [Virgibacillus litoralis]
MDQIQDFFTVTTSNDRMNAYIDYTGGNDESALELDKKAVIQFLQDNKITYGIDEHALDTLLSENNSAIFPLTIATGIFPEDGLDGEIHCEFDFDDNNTSVTSSLNFRDVMRIPSVKEGERLATLTLPTAGVNGYDVYGKLIQAHPGKPSRIKPGKNVIFHEEDLSFYATTEGQVHVTERFLQVYNVFEVSEDLSMKQGNLDFVGSIVIKGNVPSGYTVKAKGDIRIFGMVEAASIIAEGSVYISEGLSGLNKGFINAGENLTIGYINQGTVYVGKNIYAENSILHSNITAKQQVFCQRGNIIGGSISAGKLVEAKDIGNRLGTKTEIIFGVNKAVADREKKLLAQKKELQATLSKLNTIEKKLFDQQEETDTAKSKLTLLRIKNSYQKAADQLQKTEVTLEQLTAEIGSEHESLLIIRGQVNPNVIITFGRYKCKIDRNHQYIKMKLDNNEIVMHNIK